MCATCTETAYRPKSSKWIPDCLLEGRPWPDALSECQEDVCRRRSRPFPKGEPLPKFSFIVFNPSLLHTSPPQPGDCRRRSRPFPKGEPLPKFSFIVFNRHFCTRRRRSQEIVVAALDPFLKVNLCPNFIHRFQSSLLHTPPPQPGDCRRRSRPFQKGEPLPKFSFIVFNRHFCTRRRRSQEIVVAAPDPFLKVNLCPNFHSSFSIITFAHAAAAARRLSSPLQTLS